MTQIDQTFLRVHPATQTWWQQRGECESCRHLLVTAHHEGERIMRCRVAKQKGPNGAQYCIDARGEEGVCGPQAKLREASGG